jgi:FAD linked oxidases, C-terminal domain
MGYAWPRWFGEDVEKIWKLRRALAGVNSSKPGDLKSFDLIEDCALDVHDQPEYVAQLDELLRRAGVRTPCQPTSATASCTPSSS